MGGSELCGSPLALSCLLTEELGLLLAADHKGLQRGQDLEARKEKMRVGNIVISYLANQDDDIVQ